MDSLLYPLKRKVILVDGGSTDGTVEKAKQLQSLMKNIDAINTKYGKNMIHLAMHEKK